jgi:hypothetical protein
VRNHLDPGFSERVLDRLAADEDDRERRRRGTYALPLVAIVLVGLFWAAALNLGVTVVRLTIDALAWLGAVGQLEQHLSTALLGPFAPLPLIVSVLLFGAALGWVRSHQSDPEARQ